MAYLFNPITVELPLGIGIPETYIEDEQTRIKLYRRMASVSQEDELDALDAVVGLISPEVNAEALLEERRMSK